MANSKIIDPLDRPDNVDVRSDAQHPIFVKSSEDGSLTRNGVTSALESAGIDVSGDNAAWAVRTMVRDGALAIKSRADLVKRFQETLGQLQ